jgi:hypothetical protein
VLKFEWDDLKNRSNRKKHGVWFEEAQQVFDDPNGIMYFDKEHSDDEDRFILLGMSYSSGPLVVVYCERNENRFRIISARKATSKETKVYEKRI